MRNQFPEPKSQLWFNRYLRFIDERKLRTLPENLKTNEHHIFPKGLGGDPKGELITLTLREHYLAHMILYMAYRRSGHGAMSKAFYLMHNFKRITLNSREYEILKNDIRYDTSGKNNPMYGRRGKLSPHYGKPHPISEEHKKILSIKMKGNTNHLGCAPETRKLAGEKISGENHYLYGKHHSEETKRKIGLTSGKGMRGKQQSESAREKISQFMLSDENPQKGQKQSPERIAKRSKSLCLGTFHTPYGDFEHPLEACKIVNEILGISSFTKSMLYKLCKDNKTITYLRGPSKEIFSRDCIGKTAKELGWSYTYLKPQKSTIK